MNYGGGELELSYREEDVDLCEETTLRSEVGGGGLRLRLRLRLRSRRERDLECE